MLKKDSKFYIQFLISLVIMVGFGFLPPIGDITETGMRVLGIFLGCIFSWALGELMWSSLLGIIMLAILGLGTMNEHYASAFGNGTTGLTISSFVFCFAIEKSGLLKEIARWIVSQKWAQKSPWTLAFAFFIAAAFVSALATVAAPAIVVIWSLFYEVSKELGIKPFDPYGSFVLVGIAIVACGACIVMPYSSMAVLTQGVAQTSYPGFMFNNLKYLLINIVVILLIILLIVGLFRVILRNKVSVILSDREKYTMHLDKKMKITLGYLILVAFLLIVPNLLNEGNVIRIFFSNTLGTLGTLALISTLMMITRLDGKPLLDIEEALKTGVPWPLVFLISAALAISNFLVVEDAGIVKTIINVLEPVVGGHTAFAVLAIVLTVTLITTNLINDIVTATVLLPIGAQFYLAAGGELELFVILFVPAMIQGCFMPSGSIVGALMHGNQTYLKSKDVFRLVAIMEVCVVVVLIIVARVGFSFNL